MRCLPILAAVLITAGFAGAVRANVADELAEAGIPAIHREWQGSDYQKAAEVLGSGRVPLPRLSTRQGAALLQRMTSTGNFTFTRSKSLPLDSRLEDYRRMLLGSNAVFMLYLNSTIGKSDPPHEELARLMAFMLDLAGLGVELTDEVRPTIAKDEHHATRMEGLRRMHHGMIQVFQGAEISLSESAYSFTVRDRSTILAAMAANLPRIKRAFTSDVAIEMRKRLEADRARFQGEDVAAIARMIRELR